MSATIANLVMEYIEERAISTAAHPPRWWYEQVDDSHACLKKDHMQEFHDHLNSVNPNIQFTKEVELGNRLSFLDTTTTRLCGCIQVSVYRKPTHTDKYLDYNSHHPSQHKRSVINTLLHMAQEIPSTDAEWSRERKHVIKVLRDKNYPMSFIRSCKSYHNSFRRSLSTNGSSSASALSASPFNVLPYIRGVSEKILQVLRNNSVKVGYKPLNVLRTCFPRPKDKSPALQCRGVVYRVACIDCNFIYFGQTDRALETRLKEHKRAVRVGDNSKVAQNVNQFVRSIDFDHPAIVDMARNFHKRLFVEAWYSQRDSNVGNNTSISQMFTNPLNNHTQQSLVMFLVAWHAQNCEQLESRHSVGFLKKPMKATVVWSKCLKSFNDVVFNVNESQRQAQILTLMSIPDCNFSIFRLPHIHALFWESTKHRPLVHGPPLWTGSIDTFNGPGPWTPYHRLGPWTSFFY